MQRITIEQLSEVKNENLVHLNRYIKFINSRPERKLRQDGFHTHHIYPRSIAKRNGVEDYDGDWNLIELTPREHFIAHLILWKCYGSFMTTAFYFMNKCSRYDGHISGRLYERLSKEFKEQASKKASHSLWMSYKGKERLINYDDIEDALFYGYKFERAISNSSLKSIGETSSKRNKGRIHVTNGIVRHMIFPEDLPEFEKAGFHKGREKGHKSPRKGAKWMNDGKIQKQVNTASIDCFLKQGFSLGPIKTSNSPLGMHKRRLYKNNTFKYFYEDKINNAIKDGWSYEK